MDAAITTELVEAEHKRDQVGRRITGVAERAALLAEYRQSGLTQRAFAQRAGIKYCTFTSWMQGARGAARPPRGSQTAVVPPMPFVEASVPALLGGLEVTLPDGTKVRGASAREVATLVQALRRG